MGGGLNGRKIVSYMSQILICVVSSSTAMSVIDPNSIECIPCESQCIKIKWGNKKGRMW